MRCIPVRGLVPLVVCAFALASADAGDLTQVPRTLTKQPAYAGTPAYLLLVLGPTMARRAWIVIDGPNAYVDRNGNGDLTEPGEKVTLPGGPEVDETDDVKITTLQFDLGDLAAVDGQTPYTGLTLTRYVVQPKPGSSVKASDTTTFNMLVRETHSQGAKPTLGARPDAAPVVHIDGALQANVAPACNGDLPVLTQGTEGDELTIQIGTPGLGAGSWSFIGYEQVPEDAHPVLDVTFPPAVAGGAPVQMKFTLDERC